MTLKKLLSYGWLLLFFACSTSEEDTITPADADPLPTSRYFPPNSTDEWEMLDPERLGWCPQKLEEMKGFLAERGTKAFIILKNGRIVTEWYLNDFGADSLWYWASAGKTVTAYLIGKAQEDGFLTLDDPVSNYLGEGWTSLTPEQERKITIWHQLTMTTGLDDRVQDIHCTLPACLQYLTAPGQRWAYHNAPYTLLDQVLEAATGKTRNRLTREYLTEKTGIRGIWIPSGFNGLFISNARSMARFGLLMLSQGDWHGEVLLRDKAYLEAATTPSQQLNPSYGYLWWLNGGEQYMLPGTQAVFQGSLIPSAPDDLIAALGKNDQKIYVIPSQELVLIRMGEAAGESRLAASSFDTQLWEKLSNLSCP